jgi:hypothetical protein
MSPVDVDVDGRWGDGRCTISNGDGYYKVTATATANRGIAVQ